MFFVGIYIVKSLESLKFIKEIKLNIDWNEVVYEYMYKFICDFCGSWCERDIEF